MEKHAVLPLPGDAAHDSSELLHRCTINGINTEVRERGDLRWLTAGGTEIQSAVRLSAPDQLLLPNHHYMLAALSYCPPRPRVLNLGFGGGAFERFFQRRLPAAQLTSVEIQAEMVALAVEYFLVPASWPVTIADAEDFLQRGQARYDLILCDLFAGQSHAASLWDPAFHRAAAARLAEAGVMALNLSPDNEVEMLRLLQTLRPHYRQIRLATVPAHGNVIAILAREAAITRRTGTELTALEQRADLLLGKLEDTFTSVPEPGPGP